LSKGRFGAPFLLVAAAMIFSGRFAGVLSRFYPGFVDGLLGDCSGIRDVFATKVVPALKSPLHGARF
jgi:hypothetical protein